MKCAIVNFESVTMRLKVLILLIATVSARNIDDGRLLRERYLVQPEVDFGPQLGISGQFGTDQTGLALSNVNRGGRRHEPRRSEPVVYYEVSTAIFQQEFHQGGNDDSSSYTNLGTNQDYTQLRSNDRNNDRNVGRDLENRYQQNNKRTDLNIGQFVPTTSYDNRKVYDRSISSHDQRNSNSYERQPGQSNYGEVESTSHFSRSIDSNDYRNRNTGYQQEGNGGRTGYEGQAVEPGYTSQTRYNSEREQQNRNRQQNEDVYRNVQTKKQLENGNRGTVYPDVQNGRQNTNHRNFDTNRPTDNTRDGTTNEYGTKSNTQYVTQPYNSRTKTTIDNEVKTVRYNDKNRDESRKKSDGEVTTLIPEKVTLDNRAVFNGDTCPNGKVRFQDLCVDVD